MNPNPEARFITNKIREMPNSGPNFSSSDWKLGFEINASPNPNYMYITITVMITPTLTPTLTITITITSTGANNDGHPMSEFELLMMGLIGPDEVTHTLTLTHSLTHSHTPPPLPVDDGTDPPSFFLFV